MLYLFVSFVLRIWLNGPLPFALAPVLPTPLVVVSRNELAGTGHELQTQIHALLW